MPTAREALLDAALRALAGRPWRTVRMVDVAALAGVSRQTLYNEFGTKSGLATALLRQAADGYLAGVDRALTASAPEERPAAVGALDRTGRAPGRVVEGLLTGLRDEGLPGPDPGVPAPAHLLRLARDRMVAAAHPAADADRAAETDRAGETGRTALRCEIVLRLALSCVMVPCPTGQESRQCAEPDSWSPITPMITSEIDTSFSVETTSPRKIIP